MHRDGHRAIADAVPVPVIASGGAGGLKDFLDVFTEGAADAALASSIFHYSETSVSALKTYLRDHGIPVGPGRGSAAGSLAAWAMRITDVDPLHFDLFFERFLNPERVSLPDIDIDFCERRRGEVIAYVTEKYGRENVAQIITFGTMKARAVVRDVGRVMEFPISEVDKVAKLIPAALDMTLDKAVEDLSDKEARARLRIAITQSWSSPTISSALSPGRISSRSSSGTSSATAVAAKFPSGFFSRSHSFAVSAEMVNA